MDWKCVDFSNWWEGLLQGDPKRLWIVICLWRNEKCLNKTKEKINSRVYIGRFDNLPLFYLGPNMLVIKKNKHIVWKSMESGLLYRVPTQIIVQHPVHFWPLFKAPTEKLMAHSQISFKSWLNNVHSELY